MARRGDGIYPDLMPTPGTSHTQHILIVEDEDNIRDVMVIVLAEMGYTVRGTANGFDALRWLEEELVDLLILDLKMPEIDGPTLYREVLARWPVGGPRVLFVSGFADTSGHEVTPNGMDVPVLFKPFSLEDLKAAVDRALAIGDGTA